MIKTLNEQDILKFKDLPAEEKERRGILGTLFGPIASVVKATRNGRKYSDEVWEKVFNNPITKEMLAAGGIPGELDHPIDRQETCSERIAVMMPEAPKKDKDGHLVARFDIIDTPLGRVAAALARYGFKFGISSRGSGDTYMDHDGNESVDADSYDFQAFDLVLLPACEDARLRLAESFDLRGARFKKELTEAFELATADQKEMISETLKKLDIEQPETNGTNYSSEMGDNINEDTIIDDAAVNKGAKLIQDLQEALKKQNSLEKEVARLQEQLSVCYTKEGRYASALTKTKNELAEAKHREASLIEQINKMKSELSVASNGNQVLQEKYNTKLQEAKALTESIVKDSKALNEDIKGKNQLIESLRAELSDVKKKSQTDIDTLTANNRKLQESLQEVKRDSSIAKSQMTANIERSNALVEKYKSIAKVAVDKYISTQADRLGIKSADIKRNLKENYSFADIDKVCNDLQKYKLDINSLPFNVTKPVAKIAIHESRSKSGRIDSYNPDDEIDATLLSILN